MTLDPFPTELSFGGDTWVRKVDKPKVDIWFDPSRQANDLVAVIIIIGDRRLEAWVSTKLSFRQLLEYVDQGTTTYADGMILPTIKVKD